MSNHLQAAREAFKKERSNAQEESEELRKQLLGLGERQKLTDIKWDWTPPCMALRSQYATGSFRASEVNRPGSGFFAWSQLDAETAPRIKAIYWLIPL